MSRVINRSGMPSVDGQAFRAVLEREIARHGGRSVNGGADGSAVIERMAAQIAAAGHMSAETARRRIHHICSPMSERVHFDTADKILTGLELNHLWHTEPELMAA